MSAVNDEYLDEIMSENRQMRAEIERLQSQLKKAYELQADQAEEINKLDAEIERLKVGRWDQVIRERDELRSENERLKAENEKLIAALRVIAELDWDEGPGVAARALAAHQPKQAE